MILIVHANLALKSILHSTSLEPKIQTLHVIIAVQLAKRDYVLQEKYHRALQDPFRFLLMSFLLRLTLMPAVLEAGSTPSAHFNFYLRFKIFIYSCHLKSITPVIVCT